MWVGRVAMGVVCCGLLTSLVLPRAILPAVFSSFSFSKHTMASSSSMACIWLHGLGDNGPNNAPLQYSFSSPEFRNIKWRFPSAPSQRVTCNRGTLMPAWFDIQEIPITAAAPSDEEGLLKAIQRVHEMIDKEVEAGTSANKIFLCGFSQGGALTLASTLLYPKTLAGAAVFSGWVPFTPTFLERGSQAGKQAYPGLQHGISKAELDFLDQWMKARIATFVS